MNKNVQKTCMGTNLYRILPKAILAIISFFVITCVISCAGSKTISKTAKTIRSSTQIEIEPHCNFLVSLFFDFSLNTIQRMGLPKKVEITDVNKIEQFAELIETAGYKKKWIGVDEYEKLRKSKTLSEPAQKWLGQFPNNPYAMTVRFFQDGNMTGSFRMSGLCLKIPSHGEFLTDRDFSDLLLELQEILPIKPVLENIKQRTSDINYIEYALFDITQNIEDYSTIKDKWGDYLEEYISTYVERELSKWNDVDPNDEYYADMMMMEMIDVQTATDFAKLHKTKLERIISLDSPGPPQCPYALNSQYEKDSPEDTIVIFETEPGWNKYGGPELLSSRFTDPNGCFLHLKNDRIEFISNDQIEKIKQEAQRVALEGCPFEFRFSNILKIIEPEKANEKEEKNEEK